MSEQTLAPTGARAPDNPIALSLIDMLSTRFRAAARRALDAESKRGRTVEFIESMHAWLTGEADPPRALRLAIEAGREVNHD